MPKMRLHMFTSYAACSFLFLDVLFGIQTMLRNCWEDKLQHIENGGGVVDGIRTKINQLACLRSFCIFYGGWW